MLKRGKRYQSRGLLDEDDLVKVEDTKVAGDGQHLYMERTQSQIAEDFLNRNVNSLSRSLFGGATPINGPDALIRNSQTTSSISEAPREYEMLIQKLEGKCRTHIRVSSSSPLFIRSSNK